MSVEMESAPDPGEPASLGESAETAPHEPPQPIPLGAPPRSTLDDVRLSRKIHVSMLVVAVLVVAAASMFLRVQGEERVNVPLLGRPMPGLCTFKRMFGHPCPGCGLTRCFISLGHGDVVSAWQFNPTGILFFAVVLFQIPYRSVQLWRLYQGLPEVRLGTWPNWTLTIVALGLIGQWALRTAGLL